MGTPYEVSTPVMKQFVAAYEQSLKQRQTPNSGGLVLGSLGIDFTKWLPNARNEGTAKVGDADTIKISGQADIKQVIADLDKITARAATLKVPGASGKIPQRLTPAAEGGRGGRDQVADGHGLHRFRGPDPAPADGQRRPQEHRLEDRHGAAAGRHLQQGRAGAELRRAAEPEAVR